MEYEDRLRISTPEGVDLELTLAGLGSRFTAALIDIVIRIVVIVALALLLVGAAALTGDAGGADAGDGDDSDALGIAILSILGFLLIFGYDVLFEVRAGGRTIGKRMAGLRVVRTSGRPVGFVTSATRNIVRLVDFLPGLYLIGAGAMLASSRNQRLGDMAAGTIVIRDRKGGRQSRRQRRRAARGAADAPVVAIDTAGWDVSAVTAGEVATVRRFLERRSALAADARARLAEDMARRLRAKVAGAPEDIHAEAFLEGVSAAKASRAGD